MIGALFTVAALALVVVGLFGNALPDWLSDTVDQ